MEFARERVIIAPRLGGAPATEEHLDRLELVGGFAGISADASEFYSAMPLGTNRYLLGTRDPERPFLVLHTAARDPGERYRWLDSSIRDLPAPRGYAERRVNRIWTLASLVQFWAVAGSEDGCLRVLPRTPWNVGTHGYALDLKSAVRTAVSFHTDDRPMLAVGTERGTLAVFRVQGKEAEQEPPELALKFRDELRDAVVAVFTDASGPEESASRIFALTQAGRLFVYSAGGLASDRRLGHRYRHHKVWDHGSCALWLGNDMIAVGGWDQTQRVGALILIRIDPPVRARLRVAHVLHARQDFRRFEPGEHDALLAAMPLANASLRAAIAEERIRTAEALDDEPGLRGMILEARRAYPDDLEEVKCILDAAMLRVSQERLDS